MGMGYGPDESGHYERIDQLVYELYELTDEEIAIVEAATTGLVPVER